MIYERLLQEVAARAGLSSREATESAVAATLETLGERLLPLDASFVASELTEPLARMVRSRSSPGEFDLPDFYARVARREGVAPGFGREHATVVCQALAELLPEETSFHLRQRLPGGFAELLQPRPELARPAHLHPIETRPSTLSSGRPGSQRPLSEASSDRAQVDSVARSGNPHAATKLSSTTGMSTERDHRTLAEGHAGSDRPLSDSD